MPVSSRSFSSKKKNQAFDYEDRLLQENQQVMSPASRKLYPKIGKGFRIYHSLVKKRALQNVYESQPSMT